MMMSCSVTCFIFVLLCILSVGGAGIASLFAIGRPIVESQPSSSMIRTKLDIKSLLSFRNRWRKKSIASERLWEEKASIESQINAATSQARHYLNLPSDSWDLLGHEEGITVWRLKKHIEGGEESAWPCVKSVVTLDVSPKSLLDLLMDSSRIRLINRYSTGRVDVESHDQSTKIVWSKTKIPYSLIPYDFCSLMHCSESTVRDAKMIVSRAIRHLKAPVTPQYARSEVLVGVNVLAPCARNPSCTEMTSISRVRCSGVPPFLVWQNCFRGTVNYLSGLRSYCEKCGRE